MSFNDSIFRQYDIRGVYGRDFDDDFAEILGIKFGHYVAKHSKTTREVPLVAVGWDCRLSSESLKARLIKGLLVSRVDVLDTGIGPSPQLYFATQLRGLAAGIQITASHNPPEYNGFKFVLDGQALYGEAIQDLKTSLRDPVTVKELNPGEYRLADIRSAYVDELVNLSSPYLGKRKLKVVCDSGNGVGSLVGPEVLEELGCQVISIFSELDGSFPNHPPDPTIKENMRALSEKVIEHGADLGVAWDGDADRIGVVDERGELVANDMLLLLYADKILSQRGSAVVVGDIKCSHLLFSVLRSAGADAIITASGHSPIKTKMREVNATLAGDLSGHMFFADRYYGFDDGIYAACRLVEIASNHEGPFSLLFEKFPKAIATPEIRIPCSFEDQQQVVDLVKRHFSDQPQLTFDGVRVELADGWILARSSNTEPALVLRIEATNNQTLDSYKVVLRDLVLRVLPDLRCELLL